MLVRSLLILFAFSLSTLSVKSQTTVKWLEDFSMRRDVPDHYNKSASWDNGEYKEGAYYLEGSVGQVLEFMNYRILFPNNYDPNRIEAYPMIVMLHGAGEAGRSWQGHYDYDISDVNYDNNGRNIIHGGLEHLNAVNRAPSDPLAWPGIVIFPQVSHSGAWENGWSEGVLTDNNRMASTIIEHLIDVENIDPDRIFVHGLSNGAKGTWDIATKRPDLFAGMLPMSGVGRDLEDQTDIAATMPLWQFQGGNDSNPTPATTDQWMAALTSKGARQRFTLYPTLGHGTWRTAYREPDFFSWMLSQTKKDIFVFGPTGEAEICQGGSLKIGFSEGFLSYQWLESGLPITGATNSTYVVTAPGVYTVEYERRNGAMSGTIATSNPLNVIQKTVSTFTPSLVADGSIVLPTFANQAYMGLETQPGFAAYYWTKDGQPLSETENTLGILGGSKGTVGHAGVYTVSVLEPGGCISLIASIEVLFKDPLGANAPVAPSPVSSEGLSSSEIELIWLDNSNNEDYFEIYRRKADTDNNPGTIPWDLVAIIPADETSYIDTDLTPEGWFWYNISAVNNDGNSFIPNESWKWRNYTLPDSELPTAPYNLQILDIGSDEITLDWEPAVDNISIANYDIYVNGILNSVTSSLEYTITGLAPGNEYILNIRAEDFSGNKGPFSEAVIATTDNADPGLTYLYYEQTVSLGGVAEIGGANTTLVDQGVFNNFDISLRQQNDRFSFIFEAFIEIQTAGEYTFYTNSDDGSKLYIESTEVVDNDGNHGGRWREGNYTFSSAGKYNIKVRMYENTGGEGLSVNYKGQDTNGNQVAIPDNVLFLTTYTTTTYYYDGTGDIASTKNWGINTNGGGSEPADFSLANVDFVLANTAGSVSLNGIWTIDGNGSKVIVPNGITLNLNAEMTGMIKAEDASVINLNHTITPSFTDSHENSVVNFNATGMVRPGMYGHLNIKSGNDVTLGLSSTIIKGDFLVENGATAISYSPNLSNLNISGIATFNNSLETLEPYETFAIKFSGSSSTLNLSNNSASFYSLTGDFGSSINIVTPASGTISFGNSDGGGLFLEGGSSVDFGTSNLDIIGKGEINSATQTGSIKINGASISINSSSDNDFNLYFDPIEQSVNDFTMNLQGDGTVNINTSLDITSQLNMLDGNLNALGNIVLKGISRDQSAIIPEIIGGSIDGDITFERYTPMGRKYRYFGSPVSGSTVADWQESIPVSGNFDGNNNGEGSIPEGASPSLYYYDEPNGGWITYPPSGGINSAPIESGRGYAAFIRDDVSDVLLKMKGNPHQGDFIYNITQDPDDNNSNDGWNLIANVYAAPILWDPTGTDWVINNISHIISIKDNDAGKFLYTDGTDGEMNPRIAPGQGFWVQAVNSSSSLTIHETAKRTADTHFYRAGESSQESSIYLSVIGEAQDDITYIKFDNNGENDYNGIYDAFKRPNNHINLSSLTTDSISVAINSLKTICESIIIPLNLTGTEKGTYRFDIDNLESFGPDVNVLIEDKYTETSIDITSENSYSFVIDDNELSSDPFRFVLNINNPEIILDNSILANDVCEGEESSIVITGSQKGVTYFVLRDNIQISTGHLGTGLDLEIPLLVDSLEFGLNELSVTAQFELCSPYNLMNTQVLNYEELATSEVTFPENICQGEDVTINLSGAPDNGYYQIFSAIDAIVPLYTTESNQFIIKNLMETTSYFIEAVNTLGCISKDRISFQITVDILDKPTIELIENQLVSNAEFGNQWYKNGNLIPQATTQFFTPIEDGEYFVNVIFGECSKSSESIEFIVTGLNENKKDISYDLFPNPVSNTLYIKRIKNKSIIRIYDLFGKMIIEKNYNQGEKIEIEVLKLSHGVYNLQIISERVPLVSLRFIKE